MRSPTDGSSSGIPAIAVVVAAGSGDRLGAGVPKAFALLGDRPMLAFSLRALRVSPAVSGVVIAAPPDRVEEAAEIAFRFEPDLPVHAIVPGGPRRQDSVRLGLEAVPSAAAVVICHDAARPFASPGLFSRVIEALEGGAAAEGAVPVVASADTVKRLRGRMVTGTIPREEVGLVQTPQAFVASVLREAHDRAAREGVEATDDAMLLEEAGLRVVVVAGEPGNFKITTGEDLVRAEALLRKAEAGAGAWRAS